MYRRYTSPLPTYISMSQTVLPTWDIFDRTKIQSINLNIFFHYNIDRVQFRYKRICFHSFFYAAGYCCREYDILIL